MRAFFTSQSLSLSALLLLAVPAVLGCQAATVTGPGWGELPDGPGGAGGGAGTDGVIDPTADPEGVFLTEVFPLIENKCLGCHADAATGPVFIDPADPYGSVMGSDVIAVGDPASSSLVTKGAHRGPAWSAAEARVVSDWIAMEGGTPLGGGEPAPEDEPVEPAEPPPGGGEVGEYETDRLVIVDGDNVFSLDAVGLPGAELRFVAQTVALGLHLSGITLYTGGDAAVISRPRLIVHDGGTSEPDPDDRLGTVADLVVPADGAAILADNVLLVGYPVGAELSVAFESVQTF